MSKITLSVSKVYKNTGNLRFHRKKTSKHWKHYFLDDKTGEWKFNTEWVNSITAQFLKPKKHHCFTYICENGHTFQSYVKNRKEKVECPYCEN